MSTIKNARDVLLQASGPRILNSSASKMLMLSSSTPVFRVANSGGGGEGLPSVITLTAKLLNLTGTVTFQVIGATKLTPSTPTSLNTATLAFSDMTANMATVTAQLVVNGTTYMASQVIAKVFDGQNGVNGSNGVNGRDGIDGVQGQRGTVNLAVAGYSAWSDSAAAYEIGRAGYGAPVNRDIVTLYDDTHSVSKYYQSGSWLALTAYIHGNLLVAGTLSANHIYGGTLDGVVLKVGSGHTTSGRAFEVTGSGVLWADNVIGGIVLANNASYPNSPAVIASGSSGNTYALDANNSNGTAMRATGTTALKLDGLLSTVARPGGPGNAYLNSTLPVVDNAYYCGYPGNVWAGIFSKTALSVTSDAREKNNIEDCDLGLAFIQRLRPVSYKLQVGQNEVSMAPEMLGVWQADNVPEPVSIVTPRAGKRRHYGLLAQEVKQALGDIDAAFWLLDDPNDADSGQALRYEELLAPLIKAVQELAQRIDALENRPTPP